MSALTVRPLALIFDLDGTLADTIPQLTRAADACMQELGLPGPTVEQVRSYVGNGTMMMLARCILGRRDITKDEVDEALLERARQSYNRCYKAALFADFEIYPGVVECLELCKRLGIKTAVATNKPAMFAEPLLQFMGLYERFDFVLGGEVLPQRKPDPKVVEYVAAQLHCECARCVMIGDSENDILAGQRAGMSTVFFTFGYSHKSAAQLKPDYAFDSYAPFNELLSTLIPA